MRVLVVEDYDPLRVALKKALTEAGYAVVTESDGAAALELLLSRPFDVVVLDLMLPGLDGIEVLRRIRAEKLDAHVLILTARDTVDDRITGLDSGADDYLVKPFEMKELLARTRALVRRKYDQKDTKVTVGDVEIDTAGRHVQVAGEPVVLTAREYALLEYLALRKGQIVTRDEIGDHLYYNGRPSSSNVIDVYMGYLRRKLEGGGRPKILHTKRGQGYLLGVVD
ncbi:Response regulator MprA [Planctomycetes bacterium Poly30]|uniref:Response regulator MprA n=1 Tax=Saltatorellus ferox TaxID=2528018 RepID=A0A518F0B6_9BACT|nr:Response regulator MprA [Planctomycetes bacterium Poly30]